MSSQSNPEPTFEARELYRTSLDCIAEHCGHVALWGDLGFAEELIALSKAHHKSMIKCVFTETPAVSEIHGIPVLDMGQQPSGIELLLVCARSGEAKLMRQAREWAGPDVRLFAAVSDTMRLPALRWGSRENTEWPSRMYVLCSGERTGSTMLSALLRRTDVLGIPGEHFRFFLKNHVDRGVVTYEEMVPKMLRTLKTANGVFGAKIHGYQVPIFQEAISSLRDEDAKRVDDLIADASYVFLNRENMYRQAISLWRAHKTNIYHVVPQSLKGPVKDLLRLKTTKARIVLSRTFRARGRTRPRYSYNEIRERLEQVAEQRMRWDSFFDRGNVEPLRITYETLVADTAGVLSSLADHVGVDLPEEKKALRPHSRKMADAYSEKVLNRFREELRNNDPQLMDRVESFD